MDEVYCVSRDRTKVDYRDSVINILVIDCTIRKFFLFVTVLLDVFLDGYPFLMFLVKQRGFESRPLY